MLPTVHGIYRFLNSRFAGYQPSINDKQAHIQDGSDLVSSRIELNNASEQQHRLHNEFHCAEDEYGPSRLSAATTEKSTPSMERQHASSPWHIRESAQGTTDKTCQQPSPIQTQNNDDRRCRIPSDAWWELPEVKAVLKRHHLECRPHS